MTSTSFNVGLGAVSRNTSKVLKPPGGGSSDIFGSSQEPEPQRKTRNHLTSSIFSGEESQTPARKPGNDSFYNLFGAEPQSQSRPGTAAKDKFKSNIVLDDVKPDAMKTLVFSEDNCMLETDSETGPTKVENEKGPEANGVHKSDVNGSDSVYKNGMGEEEKEESNQATTDGDKAEQAVNGSSASSVASTPTSAPSAAAPPAPAPSAPAPSAPARQRVPPGGFSSGLW